MIDLDKFTDALQLTWVRRYFNDKDSQWAILAEYSLGCQKRFFEMGSLWHQKLKDATTNSFYQNLLTNWQLILGQLSQNNAISMPLWYNPLIIKSVLYDKSMYSNGCTYIADVCKSTGELLSFNELSEIYHGCFNFLDYHRLKLGFKNYCKKFRVTDMVVKPIQPTVIGILRKKIKGSRLFYNILLEGKGIENPHDCTKKWSKSLPPESLNLEWRKIFSICFNSVRDNDLVWLQYRILHKILGTKSLLFKMSIEDNNICRNCGRAEETIEHLFFYCIKVKEFSSEL